jgi:putative DNA primase/helicase
MDLRTFAKLHGVLIDTLIEDGKWHRCPTEDHPRKRNGAYRSMGAYAHVQDHANHTEPILWKPDDNEVRQVDRAAIQRRIDAAAAQIRRDQEQAARKAAWILKSCTMATHPYLAAKGFPEEHGNVWQDEKTGARLLCLPMRADGRLTGLQCISDADGFEKRFLYGQRTDSTSYVIDNKGPHIFCEGYATGLSVRRALQSMKTRYTLHICFTAGNLAKIAKNFGQGIVIADFDRPSKHHPEQGGHGVAVAQASGLPFWQTDRPDLFEDANDFELRAGTFRLMASLKNLMLQQRKVA